jgi:hypothetical protein
LRQGQIRGLRLKNLQVFNERLVSMMKDYDITLKQAIIWDMEGFDNYNYKKDTHLQHYLIVNGIIDVEDRLFYLRVVKGISPDIKLRDEQKNDTTRNS